MSMYAKSAEIIRKVRLEFPVQLTVPDPITGREFTIDRDNLLSLLVVDSGNIFIEGQTVAALFAEMARCQRACELACARAEVEFRRWKAAMVKSYRAMAEAEGKRGTDKGSEAYYRSHDDYKQFANLPNYYKTLGYLFMDLKEAFSIKARVLESQSRMMGQHEHVLSREESTASDRTESTERLEEMAAAVIAESQAKHPIIEDAEIVEEEEYEDDEEYEDEVEADSEEEEAEEGEEEEEEEDEEEAEEDEEEEEELEEEDEEEEDEEDSLPPPPPPPPKKSSGKKKTTKKPAKKATKKTTKKTTKKRSPRKRSK